MNDLIQHIARLHTTPMGALRIHRNLGVGVDNVVEYCRARILSPHAVMERRGKNWYVLLPDCTITVNASSYTIITAARPWTL